MKLLDSLAGAEFLSLVPAGGLGSRLGCLTAEQAKPSLAVSFDTNGEVIRMIDIPLAAIRSIGGAALVSTLYAPQSLAFVNRYPGVRTFQETQPGTPIDTLIANIELLRGSDAAIIGIVPGDALIEAGMLEDMRTALEESGANAAILSTRKLEGHNVRTVNSRSIVTRHEASTDTVADLGVHLMRKDWLLDRLGPYVDAGEAPSVDIWNDIYTINDPSANILMFVPEDDPEYIDMGTPDNFHKAVTHLNRASADRSGNILFPGARISGLSSHTIALPGGRSDCTLNYVIIPEGKLVAHEKETLRGAKAA